MFKFQRKLKFRAVRKDNADIQLLFDLLFMRPHNISHEAMPDFQNHAHFVMNAPYRAWYLITHEDEAIGTVYLKHDNSVGINLTSQNGPEIAEIIDFVKTTHKPNEPIKSMVPNFFYVNFPSSASDAQSTMRELGYDEIQRSYKI